ncbi:MAG: hypothetical protein CMC08_01465 [Flavobacteriaceae bacterium]|nr:hypothetical protein [Flavobacteriaceae bacterium]
MGSNRTSLLRKIESDWFGQHFLLSLFISFFVLEAVNKIAGEGSDLRQYTSIIKGVWFGLLAILLMFYSERKFYYGVLALLVCFAIGQFTLDTPFTANSILIFGKFLFPLFLFQVTSALSISDTAKRKLLTLFEWIIIGNSLLVIAAALLSIDVLSTYQGKRFGYNGLFAAVSTSSYIYILALFYFLTKHGHQVLKNLKFWIVIGACLLMGTKSIFLALGFASLYILWVFPLRFKWIYYTVGALIFLSISYYFFFESGLFNIIRKNDGLLSAILSYRNELLVEYTWPYITEKWSYLNYIFGGTNNYNLRSQIGLIDTLFFWGLGGAVLFVAMYLKTLLTFTVNAPIASFLIFLALVVSLAGNFFTYSLVAVSLAVLKLYWEQSTMKTYNQGNSYIK